MKLLEQHAHSKMEHCLFLITLDCSRASRANRHVTAEEKREALQMLEDTVAVIRRVMGPAHPDTLHAQEKLKTYRRKFPGA